MSVATGNERFVIDGNGLQVIRTGPLRGYLLVGRHGYYDPPKTGSFNAVYVVRPDAKEVAIIPGSDDETKPDVAGRWMKAENAAAW